MSDKAKVELVCFIVTNGLAYYKNINYTKEFCNGDSEGLYYKTL
jgi:hypothetical protein